MYFKIFVSIVKKVYLFRNIKEKMVIAVRRLALNFLYKYIDEKNTQNVVKVFKNISFLTNKFSIVIFFHTKFKYLTKLKIRKHISK